MKYKLFYILIIYVIFTACKTDNKKLGKMKDKQFYCIQSVELFKLQVKDIYKLKNKVINSYGIYQEMEKVVLALHNQTENNYYLRTLLDDSLAIDNTIAAYKENGNWGVLIKEFTETYEKIIRPGQVTYLTLEIPVSIDSIKVTLPLYNQQNKMYSEYFIATK